MAAGLVWEAGGTRPLFTVDASSASLLVFNLLDGLFTLLFLQLGLAAEANPLMRLFYEVDPVAFMLSKIALVHAGFALLSWQRNHWVARASIHGGAVLYAGIVAYHLAFLVRTNAL